VTAPAVSLRTLQGRFATALLGSDDARLLDCLREAGGATKAWRFAVHRNNVFHSLCSALGDLYPVVRALVGDEFFRAMAAEYIRREPPRDPAMVHLGASFPEFAADYPPARSLPYLPDVARLELAWHQAYHATDGASLRAADLAAFTPERLAAARVRLHPSLRLVGSDYPIVTIWCAHQAQPIDSPIELPERGEHACVVRPSFEVVVETVSSAHAAFLAELGGGAKLGDSVVTVAERHPDFDPTAALAACIRSGCLVAIEGIDSS
jgi:hypothetical protein